MAKNDAASCTALKYLKPTPPEGKNDRVSCLQDPLMPPVFFEAKLDEAHRLFRRQQSAKDHRVRRIEIVWELAWHPLELDPDVQPRAVSLVSTDAALAGGGSMVRSTTRLSEEDLPAPLALTLSVSPGISLLLASPYLAARKGIIQRTPRHSAVPALTSPALHHRRRQTLLY